MANIFNNFYPPISSNSNIIDDTIISPIKTWSSQKINSMIGSTLLTFNCASSVLNGDLVYFSSTLSNTVVTAADHKAPSTIIGIVNAKSSSTTCQVVTSGIYSDPSYNFLRTDPLVVFVGINGKPSLVKPSNGYVQVIGEVVSSNSIYLDFSITRIRQTPF